MDRLNTFISKEATTQEKLHVDLYDDFIRSLFLKIEVSAVWKCAATVNRLMTPWMTFCITWNTVGSIWSDVLIANSSHVISAHVFMPISKWSYKIITIVGYYDLNTNRAPARFYFELCWYEKCWYDHIFLVYCKFLEFFAF